jgi:hypothetical protein
MTLIECFGIVDKKVAKLSVKLSKNMLYICANK